MQSRKREMIDLIEFHADGFRIAEERISMQSHNSIVVRHTMDYIASHRNSQTFKLIY